MWKVLTAFSVRRLDSLDIADPVRIMAQHESTVTPIGSSAYRYSDADYQPEAL
jgi:hypothetical protein